MGFLAFVWLLVIFYQTGRERLKEANNDWAKIMLVAMTALILQGLVDTPYFKNDLSLIFWLIFGFMIILKKKT